MLRHFILNQLHWSDANWNVSKVSAGDNLMKLLGLKFDAELAFCVDVISFRKFEWLLAQSREVARGPRYVPTRIIREGSVPISITGKGLCFTFVAANLWWSSQVLSLVPNRQHDGKKIKRLENSSRILANYKFSRADKQISKRSRLQLCQQPFTFCAFLIVVGG